MRKADYAHLAATLAAERHRILNAWFDAEDERARHLDTLRRVADGFARAARIDRAAFLTACGITP